MPDSPEEIARKLAALKEFADRVKAEAEAREAERRAREAEKN